MLIDAIQVLDAAWDGAEAGIQASNDEGDSVMLDPAVLGTSKIGIDAVQRDQELDERPRRRRQRRPPMASIAIRHLVATVLRWTADVVERTPAAA